MRTDRGNSMDVTGKEGLATPPRTEHQGVHGFKLELHLRVLCDVQGDGCFLEASCVGLHFLSWILNGVTACVRAKLISTSI